MRYPGRRKHACTVDIVNRTREGGGDSIDFGVSSLAFVVWLLSSFPAVGGIFPLILVGREVRVAVRERNRKGAAGARGNGEGVRGERRGE